jgi:hypothetical protein
MKRRWSVCVLLSGLLLGCDAGRTTGLGTVAEGGSSGSGAGPGGGSSAGGGGAGPSGGMGPLISGAVTVSAAAPVPVAETFFGQNYWSWVPDWGDPVASVIEQTKELKLGLLRAGGANNDRQEPTAFTSSEIDDFVTFAREVGAEPLMQVPLIKNVQGAAATAQDAADLVTYLNITKAYGIKYFAIGNEPDLYVEQGLMSAGYDANTFCATFKEFAQAMRAVDESIQIVGPELSWRYTSGESDWLTPFLQGCGDITDIVAVHRYPLSPTQCSDVKAYADGASYRSTLTHLRSIMQATGQQDKPLALTEANITWEGDPAKPQLAASPGTFPAALWVAENLGISLEAGLFSVDYWSLSEGWTLGFFDGATPRPAFHVLKLFSNHFGTEALSVKGAPSGTSLFAGRTPAAASTSLFIVNKSNSPLSLEIAFTEHPRAAPLTLSAPALSLQLAQIPDDGSAPTITLYAPGMPEPAAMP